TVRVKVKVIFTFSVSVKIPLGKIYFPREPALAGDAPGLATWVGGALYINVGEQARRDIRGVSPEVIDENVRVEQVGTSTEGATIRVTAFGKSQDFDRVASIHANFANGNDRIDIAESVAVPVHINGGTGSIIIVYAGSTPLADDDDTDGW